MIVVIQCAAGKHHKAGHLRTVDGRNVMFVAKPDAAPAGAIALFARPDDVSDSGKSWRRVLQEYNAAPGDNPLRLLPAWRLYTNSTYRILVERFGPERLYILSAGWGLIRADFLTPNYDITFSKAGNVEAFKRRSHQDVYEDFRLSSGLGEPIVFFGGRDYLRLFCRLTGGTNAPRTVLHAAGRVCAPGCTLRRYGDPFTNWHYRCARDFAKGKLQA